MLKYVKKSFSPTDTFMDSCDAQSVHLQTTGKVLRMSTFVHFMQNKQSSVSLISSNFIKYNQEQYKILVISV